MDLLVLRQISKRFAVDEPPALDELSLSVAPGEIVALVGPSCSGKTTALRIVAGFESPDAGTVAIMGVVVAGAGRAMGPGAARGRIVFQDCALFRHLTVAGNVAFGLRRLDQKARRERLARVLDLVGMSGLARRYPHELSGGQQQRVAMGGRWRQRRRCCSWTSRSRAWMPTLGHRCATRWKRS